MAVTVFWPTKDVPFLPLRQGYSESEVARSIYSEQSSGDQKSRRRFTNSPTNLLFTLSLSNSELDAFFTFYNDSLGSGVLRFGAPHPRYLFQQVNPVWREMKFSKPVERITSSGHDQFNVQINLHMFSTSVTPPPELL